MDQLTNGVLGWIITVADLTHVIHKLGGRQFSCVKGVLAGNEHTASIRFLLALKLPFGSVPLPFVPPEPEAKAKGTDTKQKPKNSNKITHGVDD